jgi:Protein of unknown function (DUF1592)/Protein of unknown function (DUF1588)/Protein of unknown function (DUF1595)/Protein of unknown function (DUF1587)/Protein of unknown function (DUF1585)
VARRTRAFLAALSLGALGAGCTGDIGDFDQDTAAGDTPGGPEAAGVPGSSAPSTNPNEVTSCATRPDPGNVLIRRLTHGEYDNTVRDLLGDTSTPGQRFPTEGNAKTGFDNEAAALSVSPLLVENYADAAKSLAETLMTSDKKKQVVTCDLATQGMTCAQASINAFARRAFRRPVTDGEKQRLTGLMQGAVTEGESVEAGFKLALRAVLLSPKFLYRIEIDADPASQAAHTLSPHELATRLSYFLWSTTPDEALLQAADTATLSTPDAVGKQVTRMLADGRAQGFIKNFAGQWLGLRSLAATSRDAMKFPGFDVATRTSMQSETELFFKSFLDESKDVHELLTAKYTYADARLAKIYGVSGAPASGFAKTNLGSAPRMGLLTQASFLTITSKNNGTSPVKRGKWVLGQLLCSEPPPPPPGVPPLPQEAVPTGSVRQKFLQHRTSAACASCHSQMDPIGFAFESYDAVGAFRTKDDNGFAVDATGQLPGGEMFSSALELETLVSTDPAFPTCLTERLFEYAVGRAQNPEDQCALEGALSAAVKQGTTLPALVTALAESTPFTARRGEP